MLRRKFPFGWQEGKRHRSSFLLYYRYSRALRDIFRIGEGAGDGGGGWGRKEKGLGGLTFV